MKRSVLAAVVTTVALIFPAMGPGTGAASPSVPQSHARATHVAAATVAAGPDFSFVLGQDGVVYGAGLYFPGHQPTGTRRAGTTLTPIAGLPGGVRGTAVAAGFGHVIVLGDDGLAYGLGGNEDGQLTGTAYDKGQFAPLTGLPVGVRATAVAAAWNHSLVLGDDGIAYGTGDNRSGQLTGDFKVRRTLVPLAGLPAGVRATGVAAGGQGHSLVLGDDGVVYGTGWNGAGQLTGAVDEKRTLTPLTGLPSGVRAVEVAAGLGSSLVVGDDGIAYGTGYNRSGQLTGTDRNRRRLSPLAGLPTGVRATAVAVGESHSLVAASNGRVYGAGSNQRKQLTGAADEKRTLTRLAGLPTGVRVTAIAAGEGTIYGDGHSLAVGDDGNVYGAGANYSGQLTGTGRRDMLTPLAWGTVNTVAPQVIGDAAPGGVLTTEEGVWRPSPTSYSYQWSRDGKAIGGATGRTYGILPRDVFTMLRVTVTARHRGYSPASTTSEPVFVSSTKPSIPATSVSAGDRTSLVVGTDRRVYGAGDNGYGPLTGEDHQERYLTMLRGLPAGVGAAAATTGGSHSLVLGRNGRVYGAGGNYEGELTGTGARHVLTRLEGLPSGVRATAVAAGDVWSLVVGDDGRVYGSGDNWAGQLTGRRDHKPALAPLTGLPSGVRATGVAAGTEHSLVLGSDGRAYGAGYNGSGELTGTAEKKHRLTPLQGLPAGVRATAIAAGEGHSLVIGDDGIVYGAGWNGSGQLTGAGDEKRALTPLTGLPTGVHAIAIAAGYGHSLVLGANGVAYGAGDNDYAELTGERKKVRILTPLTGLPAGVRATGIAAGYGHSLVTGDDGMVYGAGANGTGQIAGADRARRRTLTPLVWGITEAVAPRIVGRPRAGETLTARHGQWWPDPTRYTYRWLRNGDLISRTSRNTYRLRPLDLGSRLRVKVTVWHPGFHSATKSTPPTPRITRLPSPP